MLAIVSTEEFTGAVARAKAVSLTAYVVRPGVVLSSLEAAGDRGARVRVRLESRPYADENGALRAANEAAISQLRAHGVDADYLDSDRPLHLKGAIVDDEVFLDDRNWPDDGRDTILRTTDGDDVAAMRRAMAGDPAGDGHLQTQKKAALGLETGMIYRAASDAIDCESESFGYSGVYAGLKARAAAGDRVRLLVAERDLQGGANVREAAALERLAAAGVHIRLGPDDEKMCIAGDDAWIGSANASDGKPLTIDWGMRTRVPGVVNVLRDRFERNWSSGHEYVPAAR